MRKITQKSKAVLSGLLDYLTATGDKNLLPEVTKSLEKEIARSKKSEKIVVSSVVPLTDGQLKSIKMILHKILKVELPVVNKIEKNLLGGFTIRVNDWFLDASISEQLQFLKRALQS